MLLEERKHHRKLSRSPRNYYNQEPLSMNFLNSESIDALDWLLLSQMFYAFHEMCEITLFF